MSSSTMVVGAILKEVISRLEKELKETQESFEKNNLWPEIDYEEQIVGIEKSIYVVQQFLEEVKAK
jgi:hypothetical protein